MNNDEFERLMEVLEELVYVGKERNIRLDKLEKELHSIKLNTSS